MSSISQAASAKSSQVASLDLTSAWAFQRIFLMRATWKGREKLWWKGLKRATRCLALLSLCDVLNFFLLFASHTLFFVFFALHMFSLPCLHQKHSLFSMQFAHTLNFRNILRGIIRSVATMGSTRVNPPKRGEAVCSYHTRGSAASRTRMVNYVSVLKRQS